MRKAIMWGGAAVTVLLVVVWIDGWREFLLTGGEPRERGLWRWNSMGLACGVPPLLAIVAGLTTLILWRWDARRGREERRGLCPQCAYDRTGLANNAVCPECGAAASNVG
jgi:hypothetical protein